MKNAIIWSKNSCPYCVQAKRLLERHNINYIEKIIGHNATKEELLAQVPNARTVPQIFIENEYVGGYDQLRQKLG